MESGTFSGNKSSGDMAKSKKEPVLFALIFLRPINLSVIKGRVFLG